MKLSEMTPATIKGIIFDFNGTMFQDSDIHESAWIKMIQQYNTQGAISEEEIVMDIHGRTNNEIIRKFISSNLTSKEINKLGTEKEFIYRQLCLQNRSRLNLTPGLQDFLNHLKQKKIPITIATATTKENIDFYFEEFRLDQWFDYNQIVYDDGTFPGKPEPDIFIKAAKKLAIPVKYCLVFEDSYSGILSASKANIATIIAVDNDGKNSILFSEPKLNVTRIIKDFRSLHFQ